MADTRAQQQDYLNYLQGQTESNYGPLQNFFAEQMGRGTELGYQGYNNINQGYDQIMGLPGGGQQQNPYQAQSSQAPPQPQQQQGGVAPSREAIMSLFPNGMTPEALKAAQPQLLQMGIHLQNEARGDLRPRMLMPDGKTVDLGDWGGQAQWQERGNIGDWHNVGDLALRGGSHPGGTGVASGGGGGGGQGGGMSTFGEFATTGGYSKEDIANMRARGVSPIRAAYANAEREIQRNRALQGGYSPNANASLVKMARERGQASADATQNVEAGLAEARNKGKQFGLSGLSGALQGKTGLFGSTPGMANMFGNQALNATNQAAGHGGNLLTAGTQAQQLPGQWDDSMKKVGDIANVAGNVAYPWLRQ